MDASSFDSASIERKGAERPGAGHDTEHGDDPDALLHTTEMSEARSSSKTRRMVKILWQWRFITETRNDAENPYQCTFARVSFINQITT